MNGSDVDTAADETAKSLALTATLTFKSEKNRDQFMRVVAMMHISGNLAPETNEAHLVLAAVYESLRTGDLTIVKEH